MWSSGRKMFLKRKAHTKPVDNKVNEIVINSVIVEIGELKYALVDLGVK
jgi:hypothetical protein